MSELKQVAQNHIRLFQNMDQHLGPEQKAKTEKAKTIYRKALDRTDNSVQYEFLLDRHLESMVKMKTVAGDGKGYWRSWMHEDGRHECTCPDHRERGSFCKHLRALAGVAANKG